MPSIVYQKNKKTGITYAYESVSYWDKDKQQPRCKRKYLGKVDPVSGEIIKPKKERVIENDQIPYSGLPTDERISLLYDEIKRKDQRISELEAQLDSALARCRVLEDKLIDIHSISGEVPNV